MSNYSVPTNLDHKPIFALRNYDLIDGYRAGHSDAQHLSLGMAQWNQPDKAFKELALKVWRHSGNRWSRQSEELPLHRAIDLVTLLSAVLLMKNTGRTAIQLGDEDLPMAIDMVPEGQLWQGEMNKFLMEHYDLLKTRLNVLKGVLDQMSDAGML